MKNEIKSFEMKKYSGDLSFEFLEVYKSFVWIPWKETGGTHQYVTVDHMTQSYATKNSGGLSFR